MPIFEYFRIPISQKNYSSTVQIEREYAIIAPSCDGRMYRPPILFNLYMNMNHLIAELSNTRIGCSVDDSMVKSHISYAGDMVLLDPSINALRKMVATCELYAEVHA